MTKYTDGKIYKIVNNVDNEIYVGSTITSLSRRKGQHKINSKKNENRKLCKHCNSIGWKNVSIVLIERYPCDTKKELMQRERIYYDLLEPTLNGQRPILFDFEKEEMYDQFRKMKYIFNRNQYYKTNYTDLFKLKYILTILLFRTVEKITNIKLKN